MMIYQKMEVLFYPLGLVSELPVMMAYCLICFKLVARSLE